jgi:hypothetical protein
MSESPAKKGAEKTASTAKEIVFTCKSCGETKPLSELVILQHFFPQIAVCKVCARGVVDHANME